MNWRTPHRFTEADMWFLFGLLVGGVIVALIAVVGALWVARMVVGG